jgi:hypothetical protein
MFGFDEYSYGVDEYSRYMEDGKGYRYQVEGYPYPYSDFKLSEWPGILTCKFNQRKDVLRWHIGMLHEHGFRVWWVERKL